MQKRPVTKDDDDYDDDKNNYCCCFCCDKGFCNLPEEFPPTVNLDGFPKPLDITLLTNANTFRPASK